MLSFKHGLTSNCDISNCSDEIAGCIEKAYEQIQFSEATRVLFFSSPKKMTDYAKKVGIFYATITFLLCSKTDFLFDIKKPC